MTITINGQDQNVGAENLAALITALGLDEAVVATALNGAFVAKGKRARTAIRTGDRIEILAPMQGG
jgi:sulfur carrier protein